MKYLFFAILVLTFFHGCKEDTKKTTSLYETEQFQKYWHTGKSETNTYTIQLLSKNKNSNGKAVLTVEKTDFSKKKHIELSNANSSKEDKVTILKLHFSQRFDTLPFPISETLSVFTPIDRTKSPSTLKVGMSSQEQAGQTYTQLNLRGNRFAIKSHSYNKGDEQFSVRQVLLEDEIGNLIRLNHNSLPVGTIDVLPGLFFSYRSKQDLKSQSAIATKKESEYAFIYTIEYPKLKRKIAIEFEKNFPFKILGWNETWREEDQEILLRSTLDKKPVEELPNNG